MSAFAMTSAAVRLSELLTARLCHELAGSITAVANGADFLSEPGVEVDQEALALIRESARGASTRLQFYRFAYGFGGDGPGTGPPPHELAARFFATSAVSCRFPENVRALPLVEQKLACNLLVFGARSLVRGGEVALAVVDRGLQLKAAGAVVSVAGEQIDALALTTPIAEVTPRTVHAYFTGLLARCLSWQLTAAVMEPGRLNVTSLPSAR
jgi:histidine phosphotransferase ChpT